MFKSNKGYSLVEIGVGIIILTVFLACSVSLFNGCYNAYRSIYQRNIAVNQAVSYMEKLLQIDSDILTGFFSEDVQDEKYVLSLDSNFEEYIISNFDKYSERYEYLSKNSLSDNKDESGSLIVNDSINDYIMKDKDYLVNDYIKHLIETSTPSASDLSNGNYAFLKAIGTILDGEDAATSSANNVYEAGNPAILRASRGEEIRPEDLEDPVSVTGTTAMRVTVQRLPYATSDAGNVVFGNKVLKLKVDVFYTRKVDYKKLVRSDIQTMTLETVKVADTTEVVLPSVNPVS